jgi:ABC-type transporter Mla maintaining outer membrane lipid asymmetry ATPase subunit MlaF
VLTSHVHTAVNVDDANMLIGAQPLLLHGTASRMSTSPSPFIGIFIASTTDRHKATSRSTLFDRLSVMVAGPLS